jgi:hypothetical protein
LKLKADLMKEIQNRISNKFLLLDTNLLIDGTNPKYLSKFVPFFKYLQEYNVKPFADDCIKFEFMRGSNSSESKKIKEEFLKNLFGGVEFSKLDRHIIDLAIDLSDFFVKRDKNLSSRLSFADYILHAHMVNFNKDHENLFLATRDNKDVAQFLLDRIHIETVDAGEDILNIGIYALNKEKYTTLLR